MSYFKPPKYIIKYQRYNYKKPEEIPQEEYEYIKNKLQAFNSKDPEVSIVLIAWNEQDYIMATLASLAELISTYRIELIVVNNNSTDNTQVFLDKCGVRTVFEKRQGYAYARQAGLEVANGKYYVSGDTDSIYKKTWVDALVKPLQDEGVAGTYGMHAFYTDNYRYPYSLLIYQRLKSVGIFLKNYKRPHLNSGGASMAFKTDLARKVGGYDVNVIRGSDGHLAFRLSGCGKIQMVASKKVLIFTNMRRVHLHGSLVKAFINRFKSNAQYFFHYFKPQKTH